MGPGASVKSSSQRRRCGAPASRSRCAVRSFSTQRGSGFVPDQLSAFDSFVADLAIAHPAGLRVEALHGVQVMATMAYRGTEDVAGAALAAFPRNAPGTTVLKTGSSEERRVGKECVRTC